MVNTITFFDPLTEDAQTWIVDSKGIPTKPERPTNKPFYIYNIDGRYVGICKSTYELLQAVFQDIMSKKKK